jgi:5-methyltetrahydropteroyltriglutamate--homocysteine methyltransferase
MTQILAANTGGFPRIGENKDEQRYRRGMTHWLKKEISAHAFRDVEQSVIQEVIREQIDAGLDEITDGLIGWPDPISFFCQNISGIKLTSYARYLNNNFYYRLPVIAAKPKPGKPVLLPFYQFAAAHSTAMVRNVLTGPLTLAHHTASSVAAFKKAPARLSLFAELLSVEIEALVKGGAKLIQINEPSLSQFPEDVPFLKKALETMIKNKPSARFILSIGHGPLAPLYEKLLSLPVDVLNLDCTYDAIKLSEKLMATAAPMTLGFGVIDARTHRSENPASSVAWLRKWIEKQKPTFLYVTPSSDLEQLPRAAAVEKLKQLAQLKKELAS